MGCTNQKTESAEIKKTSKVERLYKTESELWNEWSRGRQTLSFDDFLKGLNELLGQINLIEKEFNGKQIEAQKKEFTSIANGDKMSREQFAKYYDLNLRTKLTKFYVIGVDVGGTNTHMALLDMPNIDIIEHVCSPTTVDVATGVKNCLTKLFETHEKNANSSGKLLVNKNEIATILIGTTAFVNAVVQRSSYLNKVYVMRLCGRSTTAIPPFVDFPSDLKNRIRDDSYPEKLYYLSGTINQMGAENSPVNESEIIERVKILLDHFHGKRNVAGFSTLNLVLNGVFSHANNVHERKVLDLIQPLLQDSGIDFTVTLASEISGAGLVERENAAILNASLREYSYKVINSFKKAFTDFNLDSNLPFFFTQNDGTLATEKMIEKFPAFTFAAAPINSVTGASFLTKRDPRVTANKSYIVADIGGTTLDLGEVKQGVPTESKNSIEIGGVRTNFKMIKVQSIGLGGGSIVKLTEDGKDVEKIGPDSLGYLLTEKSVAFGGSVLTVNDIALSLQYSQQIRTINFGKTHNRNKVNISDDLKRRAREEICNLLANGIDNIRTESNDVPLILVGGGSAIIPDDIDLRHLGINHIIKPDYFDVTNAVGAAVCKVSGTYVGRFNNENRTSESFAKFVAQCEAKAIAEAEKKGGVPEFISIYDIVEMPVPYANEVTLHVKAVGFVNFSELLSSRQFNTESQTELINRKDFRLSNFQIKENKCFAEPIKILNHLDTILSKNYNLEREVPEKILTENGQNVWTLTNEDIDYISIGGTYLGSGGGGSPYLFAILLKNLNTLEPNRLKIVTEDFLSNDDTIMPIAFMGAPDCLGEKLTNLEELNSAYQEMKNICQTNCKYLMSAEIGGLNSIAQFAIAHKLNLKILDGDLMGRAYPKVKLITTALYGIQTPPYVLADDHGKVVIVKDEGKSYDEVELQLRTILFRDMSLCGSLAINPLSKEIYSKYAVKNSVSRCWQLGRTILRAQKHKEDMVYAINKLYNDREGLSAKYLCKGRILECKRFSDAGWAAGYVIISSDDNDINNRGTLYRITFQNENLMAEVVTKERLSYKSREVICTTPEIITLIDGDTGEAVLCEDLKYGIKVSVIALPSPEILLKPECLKETGPKAFKYTGRLEELSYWRTVSEDFVQTLKICNVESFLTKK